MEIFKFLLIIPQAILNLNSLRLMGLGCSSIAVGGPKRSQERSKNTKDIDFLANYREYCDNVHTYCTF